VGRCIFDNEQQLEEWLAFRGADKYYGLRTLEDNEIILIPLKTTRPIEIGYLKSPDADEIAKDLSQKYQIKILTIRRYEWDIEKAVGVKIPVE
jgi:predicted amidophosphoribosyltransferase